MSVMSRRVIVSALTVTLLACGDLVVTAQEQEKGQEPPPGAVRVEAAKYYLGIIGQDVWFQTFPNGPFWQGVQIVRIVPKSPADESDLREGQIIVRVNGKRVKNLTELVEALNTSGGTVTLKVWDYMSNSYLDYKDIKLASIPEPKEDGAP